jgi:hypothetical protein
VFTQINLKKDFTQKDHELFAEVSHIFMALSEVRETQEKLTLNCHSIARACAMLVPELKVIDGFYLPLRIDPKVAQPWWERTIRHSWLETPDKAIIEPYPVGYMTFFPAMLPSAEKNQDSLAHSYTPYEPIARIANRKTVIRRAQILCEFTKEALRKKEAAD